MDESFEMDVPRVSSAPDLNGAVGPEELSAEELRQMDDASEEFLQAWGKLVSTTNWEKGRIISRWRQALIETAAPVQCYSDEAWSRRVGNVTPQHVGRLRRVYQQFNEVHEQYGGLFWSHFQAALDWNDAEMWLEGAVQGNWSVARMRRQRWEAQGAPDDQKPRDEDIIAAELDEDVDQIDDSLDDVVVEGVDTVQSPTDMDDYDENDHGYDCDPDESVSGDLVSSVGVEQQVRPFEDIGELPEDLSQAAEAMKLAIISHKLSSWDEVSCSHVVSLLDALKTLAKSPPDQ